MGKRKREKTKSKFMIELEYRVFMIGVGIIRIFSIDCAYRLADVISWFIYKFDFKHSGRAVRHILHSGIRTDKAAAKKLARENFRHMIKVFVEIVKFDQIVNDDNFYDYISAGDDPMEVKMYNPETSMQVILATGHLGNWELAGGTHSHYTGIPMCSIGRPLANYKIGEFFYKRRCTYEHTSVPKNNGLRALIQANKKGHNITIVSDQHAVRTEGVEVMFFGHPARAHATPALLHLKSGTPIALPYLVRDGNGFKFKFHCSKLLEYKPTGDKDMDVRNVVQLYTNIIEHEIRRFPEQWLWAHRRWLDCGRGNDSYVIPPEKMPQVKPYNPEDYENETSSD